MKSWKKVNPALSRVQSDKRGLYETEEPISAFVYIQTISRDINFAGARAFYQSGLHQLESNVEKTRFPKSFMI